jgi:putative flippase GtrA
MNLRELFGSGASGAAATGIDMGLLVLLVERGMPVPAAAFIGAAAGAVVGFSMNKLVAFRDRSRVTASQLARFGIVAVATALLMAFAMDVVAVKLGVPYVLAKVICSVAVFAGWTYPAQRRLVFRRPTPVASIS